MNLLGDTVLLVTCILAGFCVLGFLDWILERLSK